MNEIAQRIAYLSPEQRLLLELRLQQKGIKPSNLQLSIPLRKNLDYLPLSYSQERLWVLHQLQPDIPFYNEVNCFRLTGFLNFTALEKSFQEILQRHEVLRSRFVTVEGRPIQVITPRESFVLPIIDFSHLPESDRQPQALQLATKEAQQPFDLAEETLYRIKLIHLSQEQHILLFTAHHIVCDGWSMGVFIRELKTLYTAFSAEKPSPLPKLPIQYADFADWQHQWLQGNILETQLAYWKHQLNGTLPVLELPTNRRHSQVDNIRGATQSLQLSSALTQALKTLSQQQGVTLYMTLLAAFEILLYRYTGIADILVGSPIANRNRAELEGLIGLFINTLILRTDLSGNPSFQELLKRVQEVTLNAYSHQDLPFEKLVEELQPERNLSQSPLFQVMFILQNSPMPSLELPGLIVSPLAIDNGTAVFDLTLIVVEAAGCLNVVFEYNADCFDADTITRMLGHWQTLLAGVVENPQQRVGELPLLTFAEQHQIFEEWNYHETELNIKHDCCVHELIEAQVEKTPDAIAIVWEKAELTYRELNNRANQLAYDLQKLGVGAEVLVGLCIERSPEMIVGMLGILKAGGAYLPLDPTYPQERLAFMLEDAQVSVIVTQTQVLTKLPNYKAEVICLDEQLLTADHSNLINRATLENLAYVIYTSGSTGAPKGVMIEHRSLVNFTQTAIEQYELKANQRILQFASISFDAAVEEIFPCLVTGATLVIRTDEMLGSIPEFLEKCRQQSVSVLDLPTAFWHQLSSGLSTLNLALPETVRLVIIGGEKVLAAQIVSWNQRVDPQKVRLVNSYGPTETTVVATVCDLSTFTSGAEVPIGKAIPGYQTYILDSHLQPVPIGVSGELHIGGIGLARGYLNHPELTTEKFIAHPFSHQPGARLYKTGDLARYLPNGNIEYLGRIDHQVKIRGFRIELQEVEAVISHHPAVQEALVIAREDELGNKRLVSYIVFAGESISVSKLRQFVQEKLPNYMVPSAFVILDALPITPNGKLDRRTLPIPDSISSVDFIAPQNSVEAALAQIWSEVLGVQQVGIYDNFFELGGDSILSIQAIAKANQKGLRLTPKQLFQYQTIAELATVVDTSQAVLTEQGIVSGAVPLTPIQHWFFQQNQQNHHHWNQSILLEVRQALNFELLEQAVQHLLIHHDALRLRFIPDINGWKQINVTPNTDLPVCQIDLSMLGEDEQKVAIEKAANQLQASLNLSQGPLMRVALFDLGNQKPSRLLIVIHHLAVDGVSWRILIEDLQTAYQQLCDNQTIVLPAKTTSFKQWSEKLLKYAQSEQIQQEQHFWLHKIPPRIPQLVTDYLDGSNTVALSPTMTTTLSVAETQALLQDVPAAYRTQINDVLLTALVQAFAEFTGQLSLLIDVEGHGREELFDDVDLSRTVGWFTSVFPVFLEIENHAAPGEALQAVKEQLRLIPNRGIGYGLLRYLSEQSEIIQQLQLLPQPEVSFNYLGQIDGSFSPTSMFGLAEESTGSPYSLEDNRAYLLEIDGLIADGQLQMVWKYSAQMYKRSTINSLAQSFVEKLRSLIIHCQYSETGGYTPSDFPLTHLSQEELDAALGKVEFT